MTDESTEAPRGAPVPLLHNGTEGTGMRMGVVVALLGLISAPAASQRLLGGIPENSLAVTFCANPNPMAGWPPLIVSYLNLTVLGADSTAEIIAHEQVHQREDSAAIAATGECPSSDATASLGREVRAYCVSDSVRVLRTGDPKEATEVTVRRLLAQFLDRVDVVDIVEAWSKGCPKYAKRP